jgi:hypothetical protein
VLAVANGMRAGVAVHRELAEELGDAPLEHDPQAFAAWSAHAPHPLGRSSGFLARGDWKDVPATVPRTLLATLRWAQRELTGAAAGPSYERYDWIDPALEPAGGRSFARVFEGGVPVAVAIAADEGHDGEAAIYLVRPGDGPRVYTLDRPDMLRAMLGNYLGDVELGEWRALPDAWPRDLARLGPAVLVLAGLD